MMPDTTKRSSTPPVEQPEALADELIEESEEEERVIDELFEHPTRDDVHEQREREQECEAVIHVHHVHVRILRRG